MRITPARQLIVEIFQSAKKPFTAPQILQKLLTFGLGVNKTTIYRELAFLVDVGIIREVNLSSHTTYYEFAGLIHHHHLVCRECGKIEELDSKEIETSIEKFEQKIKKSGFLVSDHNLEFFGFCSNCK